MGFPYRTARAVMMVGSLSDPAGQQARLIGPAHATLGLSGARGRTALCGAYVARHEQVLRPPDPEVGDALCPDCSELARLCPAPRSAGRRPAVTGGAEIRRIQ